MHQDMDNQGSHATENGMNFTTLNTGCDWNINDTEGFSIQGAVSLDKDLNFSSSQCTCTANYPDPICNMGYQISGNQLSSSACCMYDQQTKKQSNVQPFALNDNETYFGRDIENKSMDHTFTPANPLPQNNSDNRLLNCMQSQQLNMSYCANPYQTQDPYLQYYTANANNIYMDPSCPPLYNSSKSMYSSCILEQNLDMGSVRSGNIHSNTPDLSSFIPMNDGEEAILNVNETDEESDIIVEDSDTESEISIDVGPYICDKEIDKVAVMRCLVCNLSYSDKIEFVEVNQTFPVTFLSQTPVMLKIIEIIPVDLQTSIKFENNLICKMCLNLIDTIENLEGRLVSVKKSLCDFISRSCKDPTDWNSLPGTNVMCLEENIEPSISKEVRNTSNILPGVNGKIASMMVSDKINENMIGSIEPEIFYETVNTTVLTDLNGTQEISDKSTKDNSSLNTIKSDHNTNRAAVENTTDIPKEDTLPLISKPEGVDYETEVIHQCDRCGKMYRRKKELQNHLKKHNGEFNEKCSDCGKGFMKKSNLETHIRKHRNNICLCCTASFTSDTLLLEHSKSCKENKFSCSECKLVFSTENKLKFHKDKHKTSPNICSTCKKSFKHPSYLVAHMKSHSEEKPYSCEKCGRNYKNQNHLKRHMKSHDNSLVCTKCYITLPSPLGLKNHMLTHVEEVVCEICKKKMSKRQYPEHQKIHKNLQKRTECPICKKMLVTSIKVHMMKHSKTKEFKCDLCETDFTFKHSLTKHMRIKHNKC